MIEAYAWASFHSGDGEVGRAFRCQRCQTLPSTAVVEMGEEIPQARCRCSDCGREWVLLMTHLQALRLAIDPPGFEWLLWESEPSRFQAVSRGLSAAWSLWPFFNTGPLCA
jgi:hypothetical protein